MDVELAKITEEYDIPIERVNAMNDPRTSQWMVMSVPTVFLVNDDGGQEKVLKKWTGLTKAKVILTELAKHMH